MKKYQKSQDSNANVGKLKKNDQLVYKLGRGVQDLGIQQQNQSVRELGDPTSDMRVVGHQVPNHHQQNMQQIKYDTKSSGQQRIEVKITEEQTDNMTQIQKWKKLIYISLLLTLILVLIASYMVRQAFSRISSPTTPTDNKITLLIISTNIQQQSYKSIKSYLDNHKKQFSYFIIGVHKQGKFKFSSQYVDNVNRLGYEIDWVYYDNYVDITKHDIEQEEQKYVYSIQFIDKLMHKVSTEYYFFTTTQWHLQNNYFITYSKSVLQNFPTIAQILPNEREKIIRSIQLERDIGFTFACGLHRIRDYYTVVGLHGGYDQLLKKYRQNDQIQKINKITQYKLSREYLKNGLMCIIVLRFKIHKNYTSTLPILNSGEENPYTKQQHYKSLYKNNRQKQMKVYIDRYTNNFIENILQDKNNNWVNSNSKKYIDQNQIKKCNISEYIIRISGDLNNDKFPAKVYEIDLLEQLKQLPFCIVIAQNLNTSQVNDIIGSIKQQNYNNYHIINLKDNNQSNIHPNYFTNINTIKKNCPKNSLIIFTQNPLKVNSLHYLNNIHQKYKAWITYSVEKSSLEIHTFYYRIYELLQANDFKLSNQQYLIDHQKQVLALSMLQICQMYAKKVEKQLILRNRNGKNYYSIYENNSQQYQRYPYTKILRLSQDTPLNIQLYQKSLKQKQSSFHVPYQIDMKRAIDRQEQFYLPINHSIYQLEHLQHKRFLNQSNIQNHLCITILNHNNRDNLRYKKILQSVIYQFYQNYHIVFIDDNSTDLSMNLSRQYLISEGFPQNQAIFIQNLQRNYATYNIINAAFNYCNETDIQVVLDGDDQIISRDAFALINNAYMKNPKLWIVYSNYKSNYQDYGRSAPFRSQSEYIKNGKRIFVSKIGPIRTWRVKLMYSIPPQYHKMSDGNWLDTVYDDALQHSLIQLSTEHRTEYINQILYEYNIKYGDNDDSNQQKIAHRASVYRHIMNLKPLSLLDSLDNITKNQEIRKELSQDKDLKYIII